MEAGDDPAAPLQGDPTTGRARLRSAMVPRLSRRQLLAGGLCAVLGFAAVTQVQSQADDSVLASARQSDLVQILDAQNQLEDRLEAELASLESAHDELLTDDDQQAAALEQARGRVDSLRVLAGTAAATGPGVVLVVSDPESAATSSMILKAIEELRNAGAEVIQVGDVRIVASSAITDDATGVVVDGRTLNAPYTFRAIGDPETLATALAIPGGVVDSFTSAGLLPVVESRAEVVVDALRAPATPQYARPSEAADGN